MKSLSTLFILMCVSFSVHAQGGKSAYEVLAYEREVMGGAHLASPMEGSDEQHVKKNSNVQYFIYWIGSAPAVTSAIIHSKRYSVTTSRVTSLPVLLHNSNIGAGRNDTLVSRTSKPVWKLEVTEDNRSKMDASLGSLARKNELILVCKSGKSTRTITKPKIKKLEALALQ